MKRVIPWYVTIMLFGAFPATLPAREPVLRPMSIETVYHLKMLESGTIYDKIEAVQWLGEQKEPRAVLPLLKCLRGPKDVLWGDAAWALAEIGDPCAIVPLVNALEAEEMALARKKPRAHCGTRHAIVCALQKLTGLKLGHELQGWKQLRNRLTCSS